MIYFYVYSHVHLFSDMFHLSILILLFVHLCLYLFWLLLFIWTKDRSFIVYGSILYYVLFVCYYVYTIKSILSLYFSFTFLNLSKRKLFLRIASLTSFIVEFSINTIVLLPGRSSSGEYGTP